MTEREESGLVEKRKLSFFTLNYYWMDTDAFLASREFVSLLRTYDKLPEKDYLLKFCYKTFLIDLSKTADEIFAAFDRKAAKAKIRRAMGHNVTVTRAETAEAKQEFYNFYRAFAQDPKRKDKLLIIQKDELDKLEIFNAVAADGTYLGGSAFLPSPDRRYFFSKYTATLHRFCEQELLIWHGMLYAKEHHYDYFDQSWMLPNPDINSDQYRLFQFKKKFGGDLVDCYCYVKLKGPLIIPGLAFKYILKCIFRNDINNMALLLKKLKLFR